MYPTVISQKCKKGNVGTEIAEKILLYYENLNPDWLLTGRGEMLRDIKYAEPELSQSLKIRFLS